MPNQEEITPTSDAKLKAMTAAYPEIPDNRKPRCYDQCVEAPSMPDQITGIGPAYGNE